MAEAKAASMSKVKAEIRKRIKRHPEHTEEGLNIYPMMDMMTIILVFLIMQFAQDSAEIMQSDDLQIPTSVSRQQITEALSLHITQTNVLVDNQGVLQLRAGIVDPSQKQGGANGFLITPLATVLGRHRDRLRLIAERNPNRPFRGSVQIIADRRIPFRTLSEVIYTLGQNEFADLHFVTLQGDVPGSAPPSAGE